MSAAAVAPLPVERIGRVDVVIAADGGLRAACTLGRVDAVVGDLDSVDGNDLARAARDGTCIERHPVAKNETDLELAIDAACARGATRITVVDRPAGRLDHFLATMLLLARPKYDSVELRAVVDEALVTVVPAHSTRAVHGHAGGYVSLLPAGGPALDVRTDGLLYPLFGETLDAGSTRGVSNALMATTASVSVGDGALLVVQPGGER